MGRLDFPSILLKWWLLPLPISLKLNASELLRALPRFKHLDFGILETSIWLIFYRELYWVAPLIFQSDNFEHY